MNLVQFIWTAAVLVPLMFKPSPIEYFGKMHEMSPMYPIAGSGYKPTQADTTKAAPDSLKGSDEAEEVKEAGEGCR